MTRKTAAEIRAIEIDNAEREKLVATTVRAQAALARKRREQVRKMADFYWGNRTIRVRGGLDGIAMIDDEDGAAIFLSVAEFDQMARFWRNYRAEMVAREQGRTV